MNTSLDGLSDSHINSSPHSDITIEEPFQPQECNSSQSFDPTPSTQFTITGSQTSPPVIPDNINLYTIPFSFANNKFKSRKPRGKAVDWSTGMTTILLRKLVNAVRAGKRSDNGFKMEVWNDIAQTVLVGTERDIQLTGAKCQGKMETLRQKWKIWMRLKDISGFGCDPTRGVVTAPDDVWEIKIQKQPGIREFRDKPMANPAVMREIFKGIQATGQHAIYPKFGQAISHTTNTPSAYLELTINSDNDTIVCTPSNTKRRQLDNHNPGSPLGRVRSRAETPAIRLVNAVENMVTEPIKLPTTTSGIHQAINKLRHNYRGKVGWSTEDLLAGYELLENSIKAEVFLALESGEDEEMWLRRQIDHHLV